MIGGFPIITQKRSSSSLQLVNNFVDSSQELNDENDGQGCVIKNFTVPLLTENFGNKKGSTCNIEDDRQGQSPISFTSIKEDVENNLTACMTIRYKDLVKEVFTYKPQLVIHTNASIDNNLSNESNSGMSSTTNRVEVTTTTTTVADIFIHISSATESFQQSNPSKYPPSGKQAHQVTLSATASTSEIDLDFNTENFEDFSIKKVDRIKQHWKENQYRWADVNAQLVFSANGKHLSCLIPRPIRVSTKDSKKEGSRNNRENGMNGHGAPKEAAMSAPSINPIKLPGISTVVIFTLQSPTIENRQTSAGDNINQIDDLSISMSMSGDLLPQPTYLKHDVEQDSNRRNHHKPASQLSRCHTILPPLPGKPHVLSLNPNMFTNMEMEMNNRSQRASKLLSQITCLCDVNHLRTKHRRNDKNPATHKGAPLLLAGCTDGSILLIAQKRAMLLGMLYDNHEYDFSRTRLHASVGWNDHPEGVQALKYYTDTSQLKEENKSWSVKGRFLAVRRDGTAAIYSTTFRDAVGALEKTYMGELVVEREGQAADESAILLPESQSSGNSQLGFTLQYLKWTSKNYSFKMTIDLFCNNFGMSPNTAEEPTFFVNGTWVDLNTVAMLTKPLHFSTQDASQNVERRGVTFINNIAQVWSIQECGMQCYLLAELNIDNEKLQEVQNGYFDGFSSSNSALSLSPNSVQGTFIEHDICTGCLLIKSSISSSRSAKVGEVEGRHFISIWHWASCTIGFTLTSLKETQFIMQDSTASASFVCPASVYSQFNFHRGGERTTLIHTYGRGTYRRDIYLVGILSPSSFQRSLEAPNPIFLSNNSVSYPDLLEPSVGKEIHIGWKYSKIPPIYQEGQGPVEIAAIANSFGRSLAISGSRGLCVLDIHRDDASIVNASLGSQSPSSLLQLPTSCHEGFECRKDTFQLRTKQDRWRMFSRQEEISFAVKAVTWWEDATDRCEDTIVAVIQYVESFDPSYYIVAWSSRRLGMGNLQLLNDLHENNNCNHQSNKGIRLPAGFTPNQISILAENSHEKKNRATLLMTGATNVKGEAPYLLVHIQCKYSTRSKKRGILGSVTSKGMIPLLVSPSDFIFLAGSSFHFDLQHEGKQSKIRNEKRIATLGIVHDHGLAISAVSIAADNVQCKTNIIHLGDDLNGVADRITKVWLGNFNRFPTYSRDRSGTWTWSFMKSSGGIFSWAIDGEISYEKVDLPVQNIALHRSIRCKNSCSCYFGIKSDEKRCLKGSISDERTSILGPLPSTNHKHLLYSGQKSQTCQQTLAHFGLYGVSDFDIGIPSSTASFLLSLSQIVDLFLNDKEVFANAMIIGLSHDIQRMHSYETTFAGLRTIVSFITERESELERQGTREALQRYNFLHTMQSALAQITLSALIQLQFVSLFLNVGRQLEPHHFHSLFPLSLSTADNNPNHSLALQDLFDIAVVEGSFSVPAAALPLFSNKRKVHNLCVNLLHHCITTLFDFSDPKSVDVGCLREEFRSFQQLFSYTSKLEDSNFASYGIDPDGNLHDDHTSTSNGASIVSSCDRNTANNSSNDGFSIVDSFSGSSYENQKVMSSPGKIERIASLIRPLVSTSGKGQESAISDAASSFILSGYKDTPCYSKDSDSSESDDSSLSDVGSSDSNLSASTNEEEERVTFSSAGLIGMSICSTVFLSKTSHMKRTTFGLKNVAILSHLLCTENMAKTESSIQLDIVQKLIGTVPIEGVRRSLHILENLEMLNRDIITAENPEALLLAHLLIETSQLWDIDSSEAVIKTIVNILSRQEQAPEVKTFAPLLFLLLISACHLVDTVPLLFGDNDSCDLANIYRIAVQDIEEVKNIAKSK